MRLESSIAEIHGAGAEVVAISVDSDERQAGMAERWKLKNIRLVSDPSGEKYLQPMGLFDPNERGGIALPANIVIAADGSEVYRYNGRDFADRITDVEVLAALTSLQLAPVTPEPWVPTAAVSEGLTGFFSPAAYVPYFSGNRSAATAIAGRLPDRETVRIARDHRIMADQSLEAWKALSAT